MLSGLRAGEYRLLQGSNGERSAGPRRPTRVRSMKLASVGSFHARGVSSRLDPLLHTCHPRLVNGYSSSKRVDAPPSPYRRAVTQFSSTIPDLRFPTGREARASFCLPQGVRTIIATSTGG